MKFAIPSLPAKIIGVYLFDLLWLKRYLQIISKIKMRGAFPHPSSKMDLIHQLFRSGPDTLAEDPVRPGLVSQHDR
jgi:hypothetical protein